MRASRRVARDADGPVVPVSQATLHRPPTIDSVQGRPQSTRLLQAKRLAGPADDPHEQEADATASRIRRWIRHAETPSWIQPDPGTSDRIRRSATPAASVMLPNNDRIQPKFALPVSEQRRVDRLDHGAMRRRVAGGSNDSASPDRLIQRAILDTEYEDDVFDAASGKRDAQLADMRQGPIGAADPRRQSLETFFQDPANQKGNRAHPVRAQEADDRAPRLAPVGNPNSAVLPETLILGPAGPARLPEQAQGEHEIDERAAALGAGNPAHAAAVVPLRAGAMRELDELGQTMIQQQTSGVAAATVSLRTASGVRVIVHRFDVAAVGAVKAVDRQVEKDNWEASVRPLFAFAATKPSPAMAHRALERSDNVIPVASDLYDHVYAVLALAEPAIALISATSSEQALLGFHAVVQPAEWPALLAAITTNAPLLTFALAHQPQLAACANAAEVVRVWHENSAVITSTAECITILGLPLVAGNVVHACRAAQLLGSTPVPDIATLAALCGGGTFASIAEIAGLAKHGGDLAANRAILALTVSEAHLKAFNVIAGPTLAEATAIWNLLTVNVADDQKKMQMIRSLVIAGTTRTRFVEMVTNWAALMGRQTVSSPMVARLVACGLVKAKGKLYKSGTWGHGAVFVFHLAGQGRLHPEWHIHFNSAKSKEPVIAGAGWKDADNPYGSGAKSFTGDSPALVASMRAANAWIAPKPF